MLFSTNCHCTVLSLQVPNFRPLCHFVSLLGIGPRHGGGGCSYLALCYFSTFGDSPLPQSAWLVTWSEAEAGAEILFWVHCPVYCSDGASLPYLAGLLPMPLAHVAATSVLLLGEDYIITGNILSRPL